MEAEDKIESPIDERDACSFEIDGINRHRQHFRSCLMVRQPCEG